VSGQVWVASVRSAPLARQLIDGTVPAGITVTTTGADVPISIVPSGTRSGVRLYTPGSVPVPLRATFAVPTTSSPVAPPFWVGPNTTPMVQVPTGCIGAQVLAEIAKPPPVTVALRGAGAPVTVTVTVLGALVTPTSIGPKFRNTWSSVTVPTAWGPSIGGGDASFLTGVVVSLPPQPTTVSMPISPRQPAWSNRPNLLEHVMY